MVVSMKSWDPQAEQQQKESVEAFASAHELRFSAYLGDMNEKARIEGDPLMADGKQVVIHEQQAEKVLYTTLKLNKVLADGSGGACDSPSTAAEPPCILISWLRMSLGFLIVRGYRRDVVTWFLHGLLFFTYKRHIFLS